jgi:hypothetical protein
MNWKRLLGVEVLTPVVMKSSSIFWDVTPCKKVKVKKAIPVTGHGDP